MLRDSVANPVAIRDSTGVIPEPATIAARDRLSQALKALPPDNPPPFPLRSLSAFKIRAEARAKDQQP